MFQTQYPIPPPSYYPPDFQTPPHTPGSARYQYYSPRQYTFTSSPATKEHARRATQDYGYSYTTPKKSAYYNTADYSSPGYYSSTQQSSQRRTDYVSDHHHKRSGARYNTTEVPRASGDGRRSGTEHYSRQAYHHYDEVDREYEYLPRYERFPQHPPPYQGYRFERPTDYAQVPVYTQAEHASTRQRRASYSSKPTYTSHRPRPNTASKSSRTATEEDARKQGIPAGYSYKNWDPSEEPILLLGSVFDANSLGKWIYDWTVFFHGPATPMSDLAGELWLLLIQLAGKVKSAEDALPSVRQQKNRDMIEDFLDSGERLWQRFNKLLKICENYMWKAAKRESGDTKRVTMGKTSGCEFVDSIFGRDRELERTEKLMTGIRLWSLRYAANVDPILARPSA